MQMPRRKPFSNGPACGIVSFVLLISPADALVRIRSAAADSGRSSAVQSVVEDADRGYPVDLRQGAGLNALRLTTHRTHSESATYQPTANEDHHNRLARSVAHICKAPWSKLPALTCRHRVAPRKT